MENHHFQFSHILFNSIQFKMRGKYDEYIHMMNKIALIYMGGTFGCIDQPLRPMPAAEFITWLDRVIPPNNHVDCFAAEQIKDSSSCNAVDWLQLVMQIQRLSQDYQHFLIIHGTDTLSYAAATLARFLQDQVTVVITGSQLPLLNREATALDLHSDALPNLKTAISALSTVEAGVYVAFDHSLFYAASCLKFHTTAQHAFLGQPYDANFEQHFVPAFALNPEHLELAQQLKIMSWMLQPGDPSLLKAQLQHLSLAPPDFLILQGFGTGNIAIDDALLSALKQLRLQGCIIILTTQVTQGPLDQRYAISQWVLESEILVTDCQGHADLYAKILKNYLQYRSPELCTAHWYDQSK